MTLIAESVDNCGDTYGVADVLTVGWLSGSADSVVSGRVSGGALRLNGTTPITHNELTKLSACGTEFTWHGGIMVEAAPGSDTVVMRFYEGSTLHCDVRVTSAMKLRVTRNGTSVGLGTTTLTAGVWYQFNLHLKVHDTLGEVHTWVDAVADISATGLDTRNSGTAGSIDRYQIRGEFGFSMRFDDIHIWTGNDHKGLSRVTGRLPAGDGFYTDWTPSTGTDHFALVDDAAPDGDSTYVSSDTGTQRDSYEMAPLGIDPTATVHAVVAKAICRRLDIGNRILALFLRRSSTDDDGADVTPAFGYTVQAEAWETDPIAVGAWTVTNVDATEWGILDNTP